jgi:3-dehydroquinate dehydratase
MSTARYKITITRRSNHGFGFDTNDEIIEFVKTRKEVLSYASNFMQSDDYKVVVIDMITNTKLDIS